MSTLQPPQPIAVDLDVRGIADRIGAQIDNNPSPGNKDGGLTTIYEKSLGAVAKGGTLALSGVYLYGEPVTNKGFVFMDSPGFDPASVTGLVASGANVVCFTTGRGSCFGCKPTPSIKIATNTPMYERMIDDMAIRNMSPATQRAYIRAVRNFSIFFRRCPDKLTYKGPLRVRPRADIMCFSKPVDGPRQETAWTRRRFLGALVASRPDP